MFVDNDSSRELQKYFLLNDILIYLQKMQRLRNVAKETDLIDI